MHQELTQAWRPDDVMQEMLVKTTAEQSWDKAQLRAVWMESQLTALQSAQVRLLFIQFSGSDEAAGEKAMQELPKWIAQERREVQEERDLYQREMALRGKGGPNLSGEQVASRWHREKRLIDEQSGYVTDSEADENPATSYCHHQGGRGGLRRRGDRRKNGPKGPNEPTKWLRIMELTYGTNPHEPKTKPVSPLDLMGF